MPPEACLQEMLQPGFFQTTENPGPGQLCCVSEKSGDCGQSPLTSTASRAAKVCSFSLEGGKVPVFTQQSGALPGLWGRHKDT